MISDLGLAQQPGLRVCAHACVWEMQKLKGMIRTPDRRHHLPAHRPEVAYTLSPKP